MNLAYHYPIIYWNCACLSVDSSAINNADFYNLVDDDIINVEDDDNKKTQNKMDYAKMASALDKFRSICKINLPDINQSRLSFTPDAKTNSILYGLKGITRITDPVINEIMINRPFTSLKDFVSKMPKRIVTKDKIINLIKSGAFNQIEHTDNIDNILRKYLMSICDFKQKITVQNLNSLIDNNLMPAELARECEVYKLTKELRKHRDSAKIWYCGDKLTIPNDKIETWRSIFKESGITPQQLMIDGEPRLVFNSRDWDNFYTAKMGAIRTYFKAHQDDILKIFNDKIFADEYNKYCGGNEQQWELDSLNFYFHGHPLTKVIPQITARTGIKINRLNDIVEGAEEGQFIIKGKIIPKMKLYAIAGTIIDKNKVKGIVTLQCPDGVVNVKLYKDLYATFVAVDEESGQESFFEKGIHLLVTGIQRGATFVPKVYKNTGRNAVLKIDVDSNNNFVKLEAKE